MKSILFPAALAASLTASAATQQADSTGLAGDQFNLRGALELFRQSKSLEAFEQALNTDGNGVNNLDLDSDGEVDFVHVRTAADGEARVVVIQAILAKDQAQDIAAIEMERTTDGAVILQVRGDELLYPENTIIEPSESIKEQEGKRGGPLAPAAQVSVWVNVWAWPSVQWCYGPMWWEWSSPWYWGYYPGWWRPWRPWGWNAWWGFHRPYWGWYHPIHFCRVEQAHVVYQHRRSMSSMVRQRSDVRKVERPMKTEARPVDKPQSRPSLERSKQPERPSKAPETKPQRKPVDRSSPNRSPQRTAPQRQPSRSTPSSPPSRPQRSPGKR